MLTLDGLQPTIYFWTDIWQKEAASHDGVIRILLEIARSMLGGGFRLSSPTRTAQLEPHFEKQNKIAKFAAPCFFGIEKLKKN